MTVPAQKEASCFYTNFSKGTSGSATTTSLLTLTSNMVHLRNKKTRKDNNPSIASKQKKYSKTPPEEKEQRIMGIDLGIASMGVGTVWNNGTQIALLEQCCISTKNDKHVCERINLIYDTLKEKINHWKPNQIAIERVFHSKNTQTVNVVNQVHGIVLLLCAQNGIIPSEYTPMQIKKYLTGSGKADKKTMMLKIREIFPKLSDQKMRDDAADAVAVAITHIISVSGLSL